MNNDDDIGLQPGPRRDLDASNLPDADASMDGDLELESGPGSRTEVRVPLALRDPAHVRRCEVSSPSSSRAVRPRVPEPSSPTVSYNSDDVDHSMLQALSGFGSNAVDSLESNLTKSGSQSITDAEPTAYIKPA